MNTADAIVRTLESPNVCDSNFENANVVDVINQLANATRYVANAITPPVAGSSDATGGHVESLTEAVMGMTKGLCMIAASIDSLAEAIKDRGMST
jgi:hypothetical protein